MTRASPRSRKAYLDALERQRLLKAEQRATERRARQEVETGVSETVALGQARGEEFDAPTARDGRQKPVRRLSGIDWLQRQGVLSEGMMRAARDYADTWERAQGDDSIKSALAMSERVDGGPGAPSFAQSAKRLMASKRLAEMHRALGPANGLLRAVEDVFGRGMTPRQASRNGQEAAATQALAIAGLTLIASHMGHLK